MTCAIDTQGIHTVIHSGQGKPETTIPGIARRKFAREIKVAEN
jgi:hypothetical protein